GLPGGGPQGEERPERGPAPAPPGGPGPLRLHGGEQPVPLLGAAPRPLPAARDPAADPAGVLPGDDPLPYLRGVAPPGAGSGLRAVAPPEGLAAPPRNRGVDRPAGALLRRPPRLLRPLHPDPGLEPRAPGDVLDSRRGGAGGRPGLRRPPARL